MRLRHVHLGREGPENCRELFNDGKATWTNAGASQEAQAADYEKKGNSAGAAALRAGLESPD